MRVLIIRHAIAEERLDFSAVCNDDRLRPLTERGRGRMERAVQGLLRLEPSIDYIATSPLVRAQQTADIVAAGYPNAKRLELSALAPGRSPDQLISQLPKPQEFEECTVALVGHEPDLSDLIAWLTSANAYGFVRLKKGAVCLMENYGAPQGGTFELLWALTPKQLRMLGS